jgi:hypothetical protein
MINGKYNKTTEKSINDEVPAALDVFNRSVTRLLKEVSLDQETQDKLHTVKVRVTRQALGLER